MANINLCVHMNSCWYLKHLGIPELKYSMYLWCFLILRPSEAAISWGQRENYIALNVAEIKHLQSLSKQHRWHTIQKKLMHSSVGKKKSPADIICLFDLAGKSLWHSVSNSIALFRSCNGKGSWSRCDRLHLRNNWQPAPWQHGSYNQACATAFIKEACWTIDLQYTTV